MRFEDYVAMLSGDAPPTGGTPKPWNWDLNVTLALQALVAERASAARAAELRAIALAAERAEARRALTFNPDGAAERGFLARCSEMLCQGVSNAPEPSTAYTRAMTAPRMGGQHPHDGRHIMSMRHWGMVG